MNDALVASAVGLAFTGVIALALVAGPLGVAVGMGVYALVWLAAEMRYGA